MFAGIERAAIDILVLLHVRRIDEEFERNTSRYTASWLVIAPL